MPNGETRAPTRQETGTFPFRDHSHRGLDMPRSRFHRSLVAVFSTASCFTASAWCFADDVPARVAGHLAGGEFGLAAQAAAKADDPAARDGLLKNVVDAQLQANELEGAGQSLGRMTKSPQRNREQSRRAQQQATNGGVMADFQPLIDLIMNETNGKWRDLGGTDTDGTISQFQSGIRVDPHGLLSTVTRKETTGRLTDLGVAARQADLNSEMAQPSELRMLSLKRLEQEVAASLAEGRPIVESLRRLGGMTQIRYVFVVPEEHDVIIAGPAEGWAYTATGVAVGQKSHRPPLHLDDLVVTLRTFSPGSKQIFGCSIDPRPEGLQAVKAFAEKSQKSGPLNPGEVGSWAAKIGTTLGQQDIDIFGVPADSRVARTLVEADYRMKLIGIGKLDGGSNIPDYFRLLAKQPNLATGGLDALRWWLTMKYDEVLQSEDHNAYEICGSSVMCLSENQHITATGQRVETGKAEPINQQFAANFTKHYAELAQQDAVFADLQGVFDLALVAAILQRDGVDARSGWDRGVFAVEGDYRPASYNVPKHCQSVVNHRVFNGKDVVVQVAGGVRADIGSVVKDPTINKMSSHPAEKAPATQAMEKLPAGRIWWDSRK